MVVAVILSWLYYFRWIHIQDLREKVKKDKKWKKEYEKKKMEDKIKAVSLLLNTFNN